MLHNLICYEHIKKIENFKIIFERGKKFKTHSSQVIVLIDKQKLENASVHLGVLAFKKIVGKKAVFRNRAKRRYKNAFHALIKTFAICNGVDIKILALTNKNTLSCPWSQILKDVEKQLEFIVKEFGNIKEIEN